MLKKFGDENPKIAKKIQGFIPVILQSLFSFAPVPLFHIFRIVGLLR